MTQTVGNHRVPAFLFKKYFSKFSARLLLLICNSGDFHQFMKMFTSVNVCCSDDAWGVLLHFPKSDSQFQTWALTRLLLLLLVFRKPFFLIFSWSCEIHSEVTQIVSQLHIKGIKSLDWIFHMDSKHLYCMFDIRLTFELIGWCHISQKLLLLCANYNCVYCFCI